MKNINLLLSIFFLLYFSSCKKEEISLINPSKTVVEMEGEGGEVDISFAETDWKIASVNNKIGDLNIYGKIFSLDGILIKENELLSLENLGKIESFNFSIVRNSPSSLKIILAENIYNDNFNFAIVLQSGNETKEILVKQKKSEGYSFNKIEYHLAENDKDSIYFYKFHTYTFNIPQPMVHKINPVNGIDMTQKSYFESSQKDAFFWTETDSILVETPSNIWNGEMFFNHKKSRYTKSLTTMKSELNLGFVDKFIPAGETKYSIVGQYRMRRVSYSLFLTNNRTKAEKVIKGKWIEFAPTGRYNVE